MIMGCNANDEVQEIRVVCNNVDSKAAGCDSITKDGAVDTVVRLPEGVSSSPFTLSTRVASLTSISVLQSTFRRRQDLGSGQGPEHPRGHRLQDQEERQACAP
jgi:hypothetical protein